jgi:hypothetical protein
MPGFFGTVLLFCVLYAFGILVELMAAGYIPTGWAKEQFELENGLTHNLAYGIVGEKYKILDVRLALNFLLKIKSHKYFGSQVFSLADSWLYSSAYITLMQRIPKLVTSFRCI